jgi:hypothetical protein
VDSIVVTGDGDFITHFEIYAVCVAAATSRRNNGHLPSSKALLASEGSQQLNSEQCLSTIGHEPARRKQWHTTTIP